MSAAEHEALLSWILEAGAAPAKHLRPAADLSERLETYRGGFAVRTFASLAAAFPRTRRLLSDDWHALGRRFSYDVAPAEPNLNLIGRAWPDFLAASGAPPATVGVARLEWLAFELTHTQRRPLVTPEALACLDEAARLALAADAAVVAVDAAVLQAWSAALTPASDWALLTVRRGDAALIPLTAPQADLLRAVATAEDLATVIAAAGLDAEALGQALAWAVDAEWLAHR